MPLCTRNLPSGSSAGSDRATSLTVRDGVPGSGGFGPTSRRDRVRVGTDAWLRDSRDANRPTRIAGVRRSGSRSRHDPITSSSRSSWHRAIRGGRHLRGVFDEPGGSRVDVRPDPLQLTGSERGGISRRIRPGRECCGICGPLRVVIPRDACSQPGYVSCARRHRRACDVFGAATEWRARHLTARRTRCVRACRPPPGGTRSVAARRRTPAQAREDERWPPSAAG